MKTVRFLSVVGLYSGYIYSQSTFPVVTKFVVPPYPPAALAVRAEGEVTVLVEVDNKGHVKSASGFDGHPLLRRAAEFGAKDWTFSQLPGTHYLNIVFQFRLPKNKNKEFSRLMGSYTLQFTKPRVQIITTPSYEATVAYNEKP